MTGVVHHTVRDEDLSDLELRRESAAHAGADDGIGADVFQSLSNGGGCEPRAGSVRDEVGLDTAKAGLTGEIDRPPQCEGGIFSEESEELTSLSGDEEYGSQA